MSLIALCQRHILADFSYLRKSTKTRTHVPLDLLPYSYNDLAAKLAQKDNVQQCPL